MTKRSSLASTEIGENSPKIYKKKEKIIFSFFSFSPFDYVEKNHISFFLAYFG